MGSEFARFGVSKEKRKDAKIVALALVVNVEGFVKYSHIYRENIADCKTLEETVEGLSLNTSITGRKPVVVVDAGIATEDNQRMLRSQQSHYVCVSQSRLKEYNLSRGVWFTCRISENRALMSVGSKTTRTMTNTYMCAVI